MGGNSMNIYQRIVLVIGAIALFVALAIAPTPTIHINYSTRVDIASVFIRVICIVGPTLLLWWALNGISSPTRKQAESVKQVHNQKDLVIALTALSIAVLMAIVLSIGSSKRAREYKLSQAVPVKQTTPKVGKAKAVVDDWETIYVPVKQTTPNVGKVLSPPLPPGYVLDEPAPNPFISTPTPGGNRR